MNDAECGEMQMMRERSRVKGSSATAVTLSAWPALGRTAQRTAWEPERGKVSSGLQRLALWWYQIRELPPLSPPYDDLMVVLEYLT